VFKDVNYGASKASATQNTAANPADLADGSVGIYAIHRAGSTNLMQLVLVTDGGSETAGFVPVASLVADEFQIAMGTPNGNIMSNPIANKQGLHDLLGSKYTAPVKGVSVIGYTAAGGLLNFPATIVKGNLLSVQAINRRNDTTANRLPYATERYSVELATADTAYASLVKLVKRMTAMDPLQERTIVDVPIIVSNASGSAFAASATVAVVNGGTTFTTSAAHTVTVGQWVSLAGDLYQAITGTTGSTLVIDRPYTGATGTIANANTINTASTSVPTQLGLQFTDTNFYSNVTITTQGVLENATITKTVLPIQGTGTYDHVLREEKEYRSMLGTSDEINAYIPKEPFKAVAGTTYDFYNIGARNPNFTKGDQGSVFKVQDFTLLFFVVAADTTNKAQSDFEDILQSSTMLGTGFPSISA
jgi:hypothetical protein